MKKRNHGAVEKLNWKILAGFTVEINKDRQRSILVSHAYNIIPVPSPKNPPLK